MTEDQMAVINDLVRIMRCMHTKITFFSKKHKEDMDNLREQLGKQREAKTITIQNETQTELEMMLKYKAEIIQRDKIVKSKFVQTSPRISPESPKQIKSNQAKENPIPNSFKKLVSKPKKQDSISSSLKRVSCIESEEQSKKVIKPFNSIKDLSEIENNKDLKNENPKQVSKEISRRKK